MQDTRVEGLVRRLGDVVSQIHIRLQALNERQSVARLQIADAAVGTTLILRHREDRNGIVRRRQCVARPIVIARGRHGVENGLRRTHLRGIGEHTARSELIVGARAAQARANVEPVVEQTLVEVQSQGHALRVSPLDHTTLTQVASRYPPILIIASARDREVVLLAVRGLIDEVEPIGAGGAELADL